VIRSDTAGHVAVGDRPWRSIHRGRSCLQAKRRRSPWRRPASV